MFNPTPTPDQADTIARLERLTGPAWTVDAGPIDITAVEPCDIDTDHGPAVVCTATGDLLCVECALAVLNLDLHAGSYVSLDVLKLPAAAA